MTERTHPAVVVVANRAQRTTTGDTERLRSLLRRSGRTETEPQLVAGIRRNARLTLNFHPDRLTVDGVTVAEGLARTGRYLPQSATGISNGSRSAIRGGDRTRWERELFEGVYDRVSTVRPVYGSLDVTRDPHGGSPRFGSSYAVLSRACLDRATFCVGDSHAGPTDLGTVSEFTSILAGVFEEAARGDGLSRGLGIDGLCRSIMNAEGASAPARALDGYIEAQVHGAVALHEDVEAVVLDPSFRGTDVEVSMGEAARRYRFEMEWHRGSVLDPRRIPVDFRGPDMAPLAHRVARPDGLVDAAAIGRGAAGIQYDPPTPTGDPPGSQRQLYKYLWHCVLAFGVDAD